MNSFLEDLRKEEIRGELFSSPGTTHFNLSVKIDDDYWKAHSLRSDVMNSGSMSAR
jgi:hypothetical protein